MYDKQILRQIIMDHYTNPLHKQIKKSFITKHYNSPTCVDDITVGLKFEKNKLVDAGFIGIACAICTSSTDIIIDQIIGKQISEIKLIITNYLTMIKGHDDYDKNSLDELIAFVNVYKQPSRINCATLGIKLIQEIIKEYESE